nr:MAG TPA: hypothetical protein [Caudoviricetes sp.]DAQ23557.1 MAG TPA: hypothetical protein [Caudoviricetes sp.]DAZ57728.1 MAG TPA: hypothetical protein [Caudoviricetes sp.]
MSIFVVRDLCSKGAVLCFLLLVCYLISQDIT